MDDDIHDGAEPRDNQDTYWSEQDRRVIGPCQGLMKASAACLRKLTAAVRSNGDVTTAQNVAQLDDLADATNHISPVWVPHGAHTTTRNTQYPAPCMVTDTDRGFQI